MGSGRVRRDQPLLRLSVTSTWHFFTLNGCDFEPLTTADGQPFGVAVGASASYVASIFCTPASNTGGSVQTRCSQVEGQPHESFDIDACQT